MSSSEAGLPTVLVLAGLDPSGGAGLWADGAAIQAAGGRPLLCATAITAQSTSRVHSFHALPAQVIEAQVLALVEDEPAPIGAVKVGMIGSAAAALAIADLREHPALRAAAWVIDPVLRSSSGAALVEGGAAAYERILPRATLLTPNVPEALELGRHWMSGGQGDAADEPAGARAPAQASAMDDREEALLASAEALLGAGARAVLLKGGHLRGPPVDRLITPAGVERLEGRRRPGARRGTGCRLASFLAARLAAGVPLPQAAAEAKDYVASYLDRG